jgi:co-chaperonin GroES (HSP10)
MSNEVHTVDEVLAMVAKGMVLRGERVVVYIDQKSDTFADSVVIKADMYKQGECKGFIVGVGDQLTKEDRDRFRTGDKVVFNYVGAAHRIDNYYFEEGSVQLATMSIKDITATLL